MTEARPADGPFIVAGLSARWEKRVGVTRITPGHRHAHTVWFGIDRFSLPAQRNRLDSRMGGYRGIIREAFFEHTRVRSRSFVRAFDSLGVSSEAAVGRSLYTRTRGITVGAERWVAGARSCAREAPSWFGVPHWRAVGAEVTRNFPGAPAARRHGRGGRGIEPGVLFS
jgi:hypothetical protein